MRIGLSNSNVFDVFDALGLGELTTTAGSSVAYERQVVGMTGEARQHI